MADAPVIGKHLATLNLFREPDGTVEITVADARGAIDEMSPVERATMRPSDYVEIWIIQAVRRMENRREGGQV